MEHTPTGLARRSAPLPVSSGMPTDSSELPFEIRPSAMQGLGAFATQRIATGVRLIEYAGERLSPAESEARYPDVEGERHHTFLFAIDDDVVIDAAVDGNEARFINHSCDPNCDAVIDDGRIWIETIRDVAPGEELAYDYAYVLEERHTPAAKRRFPCACGAATCRGTILAKKR
ncbi:MAG: SET domain-containing protein-lysine N-methyltransferase [bacterium]